MDYRMSRIDPLSFALVAGILYGCLSIIAVVLLAVINKTMLPWQPLPWFFFLLPIVYAIAAFIFGFIAALLYNIVARWTGGIRFVLTSGRG